MIGIGQLVEVVNTYNLTAQAKNTTDTVRHVVQYVPTWVSPRYYTVDPVLLPSGNPFKCHQEFFLYLQSMVPPKSFDIFPPAGGCSEGLLDAFRF